MLPAKRLFQRMMVIAVVGLPTAVLGIASEESALAQKSGPRPSNGVETFAAKPPLVAFVNDHGQLAVMSPTGKRRRQLTFVLPSLTYASRPRWGPFGGKILYVRVPNLDEKWHDLWLIGADGRHNHRLKAFNAQRSIRDIAWAPGGGRIALVMDNADSTLTNGTYSDLFIYTPRTDTLKRLHVGNVPDRTLATVDWSHDGRRLVFSAIDYTQADNDQVDDLYTVAPDGSGLQQITHSKGIGETNPRWSPDDSRLLFSKQIQAGNCGWFIVNAAADATDQRRVRGGCYGYQAGWSPNARRAVIWKADGAFDYVLWTVALNGSGGQFLGRGQQASYRPQPHP
jgi:hypothetical protein